MLPLLSPEFTFRYLSELCNLLRPYVQDRDNAWEVGIISIKYNNEKVKWEGTLTADYYACVEEQNNGMDRTIREKLTLPVIRYAEYLAGIAIHN